MLQSMGGGVLSNCNLLYVNIGELESTVKQTDISSVSAAAGELLPGVENTTLSCCLSTEICSVSYNLDEICQLER